MTFYEHLFTTKLTGENTRRVVVSLLRAKHDLFVKIGLEYPNKFLDSIILHKNAFIYIFEILIKSLGADFEIYYRYSKSSYINATLSSDLFKIELLDNKHKVYKDLKFSSQEYILLINILNEDCILEKISELHNILKK